MADQYCPVHEVALETEPDYDDYANPSWVLICPICGTDWASHIFDDTDTRRARDEAAYFAQFYATGEEG